MRTSGQHAVNLHKLTLFIEILVDKYQRKFKHNIISKSASIISILLSIYFVLISLKNGFQKFALPKLGCNLSVCVAYLPAFSELNGLLASISAASSLNSKLV